MNYKFDFSDFHGLDILKGQVQMKTGVSQTQALRFVADVKSLLGVDLPTSIIISSPIDFHDEDAESPVKIIVRLAHGEQSITMDATVDFDCILDPAIFSRVSWDDFLSEVKKHRKMIGEVKMSLLHMDPKETHSMSTGDIFA
jgi:hypothetical protein